MIEIATSVLTGTGILAGAGLLAGHGWRTRNLGVRSSLLGQRLNEVEATMYAHDEPDELAPQRAAPFALSSLDGAAPATTRCHGRHRRRLTSEAQTRSPS